jgi:hypothetical protein
MRFDTILSKTLFLMVTCPVKNSSDQQNPLPDTISRERVFYWGALLKGDREPFGSLSIYFWLKHNAGRFSAQSAENLPALL